MAGGRRGLLLAAVALTVALIVLLATTGPQPELEASGPVRRDGGICLQLERWSLFGWRAIGQTHDVEDVTMGFWHEPIDSPPCDSEVPEQIYLVRPPPDAPPGSYRICGIFDDEPCLEFVRVEFVPGPGGP